MGELNGISIFFTIFVIYMIKLSFFNRIWEMFQEIVAMKMIKTSFGSNSVTIDASAEILVII